MNSTEHIAEAQLVQRSLAGDHSAFEEIVRRNLSPVAAVAYALTGDAAAGEDVAQEVFLTAWQRLRELREPEKLRSWLCAIARNTVHAQGRRRAHDPLHRAAELQDTAPIAAPVPGPADDAIAGEQRRLVWSAIEQIPENYRVPLVLYYREGHSTAEVAAALDMSEEAVRQRLSRARALLKDEVARVVETSISATRPSPLLVPAIMAGLAGGSLHASAATTATAAAAKIASGGAGAGTAGIGAVLGAVLGPLVGMGGAVFGCTASLRACKTPEERRVIIESIWQMLLLVAGQIVLVWAAVHYGRHMPAWFPQPAEAYACAMIVVVFVVLLVILVRRTNKAYFALVATRPGEKPTPTPQQQYADYVRRLPNEGRWGLIAAYGGGIYGSTAWILAVAAVLHQPILFVSVLGAATAVNVLALRATMRCPENHMLHMALAVFSMPAIYLAAAVYWKVVHVEKLPAGAPTITWGFVDPTMITAIASAFAILLGVVMLLRHRKVLFQLRRDGPHSGH
jgi:RNA polymerase sigma factor (sigma-70 family)